jgi:hypothetical protein
VGAKYKNKYRSLVYNIKDVKNDGLFRRILLRDLSPIEVRSSSGLRIRDPVLFLRQDPGSGMYIPDNFSESLETVFRAKDT